MKTMDEAREAGRIAARDCSTPLHDLTGHMGRLGIPQELRGAWLSGLEDGLMDQGYNVEGTEGDGHDWERQALARMD